MLKQLNDWRPTADKMNLRQQVVSLDLAKRLKELGYKQDSYFRWVTTPARSEPIVWDETMISDYDGGKAKLVTCAVTVAELGEILPVSAAGAGK
jgi:hypothetical protein